MGLLIFCIIEKMQNIEPEHWAPHVWASEHVIAAAMPEGKLTSELAQSSINRIYSLCHLTPCETCRGHYNTFVEQFPPQFETGLQVQKWWWKCHNYVNRTLGRAEWTLDQLQKKYPPSGVYSSPSILNYPVVPVKPQSSFGYAAPVVQPAPNMTGWNAMKAIKQSTIYSRQPTGRYVRQQVFNQRYLSGHRKPIVATATTSANIPGSNYPTAQTRQWRALTKLRSSKPVTKKGCSSCGRRRPGA
jgi:hypothetical protein